MNEEIEKNKELDVFVEDFSDKVGKVQDILKLVDEYVQSLNNKISESSKKLNDIQQSDILTHYSGQLEDIHNRSEELKDSLSRNLEYVDKQITDLMGDFDKLDASNNRLKQLKKSYEEIKKNAKEYQVSLQKSHDTFQSTVSQLSDIGEQIIASQKQVEDITKENLIVLQQQLDTQVSIFKELKDRFQTMTEQKDDFAHEFEMMHDLSNNLNVTLQQIKNIRSNFNKGTEQLNETASKVRADKDYMTSFVEKSLKEFKVSIDDAKNDILKEVREVQYLHLVKLENKNLQSKLATQEKMIERIKNVLLTETLPPAPSGKDIKLPPFTSKKNLTIVNDLYHKEQELNDIMDRLASELNIKRNI